MMAHDDPIPGCRSFVVANDPTNPDSLWITEVWDSEQAWQASMEIPAIKSSIDKAAALVADWGQTVVTAPVGLIP
jgi:quinol monooxygenase YgiN